MSAPVPHVRKKGFLKFFPSPEYLTMPAAGLDISDYSVKFVEMADTGANKELKRFGERAISRGIISQGEVINPDGLRRVLRGLRSDFDLSFVRASLPEEKAYLFQTEVPRTGEEIDLRTVIEFKLEENVPLPLAEMVFDYEILKGGASDKNFRVSVSAYPRKTVEQYTTVFREAGLTPLSLEIEAQAIARAVVPREDDGTYMIVDFGRERTGLSIVSEGVLSFTSTLEVGGDALTRAIEKHFNVTEQEAEKIKNERGFIKQKDNKELFMSLMTTVSALKDEINKHSMYWSSRASTGAVAPVEKIILCGGNANLAGLPEYLGASMRVAVERADIWQNAFSFEQVIPEIPFNRSLGYATAVGLALRDLN